MFVDRDGTINPDLHYLAEPERLELNAGVGAGVRLLRSHGFRVVCVTNQSGVRRGLYTDEIVGRIHARVNERLAREGGHVDAFYYCPHAPADGCRCRKPGTLLFELAAHDLDVALPASAMVGDRPLDILAGEAMGLLTVAVPARGRRAEYEEEARREGAVADLVAPSFLSAALSILARG